MRSEYAPLDEANEQLRDLSSVVVRQTLNTIYQLSNHTGRLRCSVGTGD
jgi:hypothetical protein